MPPRPTTGIFTALHASYTMRRATGFTAGPESPPNPAPILGLRVRASIARPITVLISDTASAPCSSAAFAIGAMLATFGDSFTITGRFATARTAATTSPNIQASAPKAMPPFLVLGQLTFSSYPARPSASSSARTTST